LTAAGGGWDGWCVKFDHDGGSPFFVAVFAGCGGGCGCDLVFCGRGSEGTFIEDLRRVFVAVFRIVSDR